MNRETLAHGSRIQIVSTVQLCTRPTVLFRETDGNFSNQVALAARLSDLVVFGPINADERPGSGMHSMLRF